MNVSSKPKMQTLDELLVSVSQSFASVGIPTPRLDAEILLSHTLGQHRAWLVTHGDKILGKETLSQLRPLVERRLLREPIAYIIGTKEFYGREFIVTPDVLIPRPETEELIELTKRLVSNTSRILDVGCGSGCVGITLKLELPESEVALSDISKKALDVARRNAQQLNVEPVRFVQSDLLAHWLSSEKRRQFDTIVANLPYVNRAWETSPELTHEPELALYAEQNGLALIYQLIEQSPHLLMPQGFLLLEADPKQHAAMMQHAASLGFTHTETQGYAIALQLRG